MSYTKKLIIILLLFNSSLLFSQEQKSFLYNFLLYDGSENCFTMNQFDQNYLSASRLFRRIYYDFIEENSQNNITKRILQASETLLEAFFFTPLTHEEAHRSILTNKGIASISQPIPSFQSLNIFKGVCYVKGVSDLTLNSFRNTDFPSFIRMHTAGIESDYLLSQYAFRNMALGLDYKTKFRIQNSMDSVFMYESYNEYLIRTISVVGYCFPTLIDSLFNSTKKLIEEEQNELERDIVGHDIYGMVHHLFNPTADYSRYWDYFELEDEEKRFVKRIGLKSLLNIPVASPLFWTKDFNIEITENLKISWNTGFSLAPFGDFMDEIFYLRYDGYKVSPLIFQIYIREYQNKNNWFPAFGVNILSFHPYEWIYLDSGFDIWFQPKNLDFTQSDYDFGGAVNFTTTFILPLQKSTFVDGIGLNVGCLYKTYGYLPEVESHEQLFKCTLGVSVKF